MYIPIESQRSCARAWVAAASRISAEGEDYNVVFDIEDPVFFDDKDNAIVSLVDDFLRNHGVGPISMVANTLFPQSIYRKFGAPAIYGEYIKVYKKLTKSKSWGRYFLRMTRRCKVAGRKESRAENLDDADTYNPLADLIAKMKRQKDAGDCVKAMHEMAIYDPLSDRTRYSRGGPCLSFLSFKRHPVRGLLLTAVYRNHSYITRCLGNLIGLGRLQAFVAKEVGIPLGSLTCISTHAEIDVGKDAADEEDAKVAKVKWTLTEARKLVADAASILNASTIAESETASAVA